MKFSIGIVGLPNVGKSTLFHALTKKDVTIANYPFATIDPNVGIVAVPDERLDTLAALSRSKKKVPAIVEFWDIAGLVKNASKGEGLGNQFLSHIREVNALVHVVRCFPLGDIIHVEQSVDPIRDMGIVNAELALKDAETVEKHLAKLSADTRSHNAKTAKEAKEAITSLTEAQKFLVEGKLLLSRKGDPAIKNLQLLTAKPQIYLLNGSEIDASPELRHAITESGADYIILDLAANPDLAPLIKKAYDILNYISFFTTGEDETRAWTIVNGATAPEAAGAIHTDFQKNFIKAEVVSYADLTAAGGWNAAKTKGKVRLEGKEYVAKDGDVMVFKHG